MTTSLLSYVLVLTSCFHVTFTFSRGAPHYACKTLLPGHTGKALNPADDPAPYTVTAGGSTVVAGGTFDVTISATSDVPFKGFLCVANNASDTQTQHGTMTATADTMQTAPCDKNNLDIPYGITHKNSKAKSSIKFTWNVPGTVVEGADYKIRCAIVQQFSKYWNHFQIPIKVVTPGQTGNSVAPDNSANQNGGFSWMPQVVVAVVMMKMAL